MYPPIHSYLLWRSSVKPDSQVLASRRHTAAVSLIPACMVGVFVFGWWAAWILFLSVATAFLTDFVCHRFIFADSSGTRDGTWMLTGLLIGLLMPPNVPWILPILGASVAVFLGKYYLSVDGMTLLQPAAVGLLSLHLIGFLWVGGDPMLGIREGQQHWPVLERAIEPSGDASNAADAVKKMVQDFFGGDVRKSVTRAEYRQMRDAGTLTSEIRAVHGARPIDLAKSQPSKAVTDNNGKNIDWLDMLLGYRAGTIGGSGAMAICFGVLLLLFTGAASPAIPLFALATLFAGLEFAAWASGSSRVISDNISIHLLTGSTLLAFFYLGGDTSSTPKSFIGKVYAGVALGVIELLLRLFTPLSEGIFISIILVQGLSIFIDQYLAPPKEESVATPAALTPSSLGRL